MELFEHSVSGAVDQRLGERFKDIGRRLRNWDRWGATDRRGTLNLITAENIAAATRLVRAGRTIGLGRTIDSHAMATAGAGPRRNLTHLMSTMPGDCQYPDGVGFADDYVVMPLQCGTHWDGLAHCFYDGCLYNGYSTCSITAARGSVALGIEAIGDGVVGRGVLLDIAALKGVAALPVGHVISADDLDEAERRQSVRVGSGDIVLVRTGWPGRAPLGSRATRTPARREWDPTRPDMLPEPGLSLGCCEWLHRRDVAAVASDNYAIEVIPVEDRRSTLPVHSILIRDMGMTLGELFDLETLARDCETDRVWEFFFAAPPLKVSGGVGSPVNPIAIK